MTNIGKTDNDPAFDRQMAKLHEENATHNAQEALKQGRLTREELLQRVDALEASLNRAIFDIQHLHQKYNLLLSARFNTGPTVSEE